MLKDIIEVQPRDGWKLWLRFEDGVEGIVDLAQVMRFEGVFEPLSNRDRFVQVAVLPEFGTIGWPWGADLDPDVLYAQVVGQPLATASTTRTTPAKG